MMHRQRIATLSIVAAMALTACGGSSDDVSAATGAPAASTTVGVSAAGSEVTSTSEATTTSTATTSTTTTTTATTTAAPGCDSIPLPEEAEVGDTYGLDVDADGTEDTVTVYFDSSTGPGEFGSYGLFVEYASGGSTLLERPVYAGRQPIVPIGLHDVQGDGAAELFVLEYRADQGISYESGAFTNIFVANVAECAVTVGGDAARPTSEFGALFAIGTYPPQGVHLVCEEDQLRRYDYYEESRNDSSAFRVSVYPYEYTVDGWDLLIAQTDNLDIPKDEMLARPLLDCGDLELPAPRPAE